MAPLVDWNDPSIQPDLRREYGGWIGRYRPWDWWVTLTFRVRVTQERARDIFRAWTRKLARTYRVHIDVAWVIENNGGRWHVHALLCIPETAAVVVPIRLDWAWLGIEPGVTGFSWIKRYDPALGAAYYIAEKCADPARRSTWDWNVSVVCPRWSCCRRKKTCVYSSSAW